MRAAELREKTIEEMQSELMKELRARFNLNVRRSTGQLDKPSEVKKTRRNIARIKTLINEKRMAIGKDRYE